MPASMRMPRKKNGIVYLVDRAARFVITTRASDTIAAMINEKDAPCTRTAAIVSGKKTADMEVIETPTHPIWCFLSSPSAH